VFASDAAQRARILKTETRRLKRKSQLDREDSTVLPSPKQLPERLAN
jgi:hypothetical protein